MIPLAEQILFALQWLTSRDFPLDQAYAVLTLLLHFLLGGGIQTF